jgi:carbon storage regulator CsrA
MLTLTRKENDSITIETPTANVVVYVGQVEKHQVRLRIDAPKSFRIWRTESNFDPNDKHDHKAVLNCGRCGKDHEAIPVVALKFLNSQHTHHGICPRTGEPVLI